MRWTFRTVTRGVMDQLANDADAPLALSLVFFMDDDRTVIAHTAVVTIELFRTMLAKVEKTAEKLSNNEDVIENPLRLAAWTNDLVCEAELCVGIAVALRNHAQAMAAKQGAGL